MSQFNPSDLKYEFKDFIGIYENAFTKEECENAIKLFEKHHELGYTDRRTIENVNILHKKNDLSLSLNAVELEWHPGFISSFHERFYDFIYPIYSHEYTILNELIKHRSKFIKIQKTFPTQGYHIWHCEHGGNQHNESRVLSWILYLNDVEEGGETEFLYQSLRVKPKTGTFILFPAYFTHTHRGNPPLSGIKYIATGWIEYLHTSEQQGGCAFPNLSPLKNQLSGPKINYS